MSKEEIMPTAKEFLENRQAFVYLAAIFAAVMTAMFVPRAEALEIAINPALAVMLFVTFLQVPLSEVGKACTNVRFLAALLAANFVALPPLVVILTKAF